MHEVMGRDREQECGGSLGSLLATLERPPPPTSRVAVAHPAVLEDFMPGRPKPLRPVLVRQESLDARSSVEDLSWDRQPLLCGFWLFCCFCRSVVPSLANGVRSIRFVLLESGWKERPCWTACFLPAVSANEKAILVSASLLFHRERVSGGY